MMKGTRKAEDLVLEIQYCSAPFSATAENRGHVNLSKDRRELMVGCGELHNGWSEDLSQSFLVTIF
jgi:hypothetical protein